LAKLKAGSYLAQWRRAAHALTVELKTKERIQLALNDAKKVFEADKENACKTVAIALKKEREEYMAKFADEAMNKQAEAVSSALQSLKQQHDVAMEEMMSTHNERIDRLNKENEEALNRQQVSVAYLLYIICIS
jgi:ribosomal protein L19